MNLELHWNKFLYGQQSNECGRTTGKGIGRQEDNFMVLWFVASHRFLPEFDELSPTNIFPVLFPTTSSSSSSCSCPVIPMSPCKLCSIIIYQISGLWNFPFPIPARIFCVRNNENGAKNDDPPNPLINKWIRKWDSIEPKTVTDGAFCSTFGYSCGKEATTEFGQAEGILETSVPFHQMLKTDDYP